MRPAKRILLGLMAVALGALIASAYYVTVDARRDLGDTELVTVIVSTEDIPGVQDLDPLIERGVFNELALPREALIEDAVTDIRELAGVMTINAILKNEQISRSRLAAPDPT